MSLIRQISREEVSEHNGPDSCWVILRDSVYDLTPFIDAHPGGAEILLEMAGTDATESFEAVGHSIPARILAEKYKIGELPVEQCDKICTAQYISYQKRMMSCPMHVVA